MAVGSALKHGARTIARRDFWSFKVTHAVLGGLLTVAGACGSIFVVDQFRTQVGEVDGKIAEATRRIDSMERALFQFQFIQVNGLLMGALTGSDALRPEYRDSFLQLSFVVRQMPTSRLLQELYVNDSAGFLREREEYLRLIEAAKPANDKAAWDALLAFEINTEKRVFDLQQQFVNLRYEFDARRRLADSRLQTATLWGFILQQLGFVLVLLAGLVYQHAPAPQPGATAR